ncbi:alpha/beta-hydrolase [Aspergillus indologenus CBS 114.80]|uniref:Alpha/beta-hydrolase n=1 Tax=Aspergillus indologenus CBS 114.80 TaxID=1450541 RepID=A0A2V5JB26_9EURO|nr:alpha/beta-hydrolase [Aspergillus indologenus CBS 114.80]
MLPYRFLYVERIAAQPWCDGNVALGGNSWLGMAQWFIAAERPPHLRAIAPWEGTGDFYCESICRGGIPNYAFWDPLMREFNVGKNSREDVVAMIYQYPHMNAHWGDQRPRLQDMELPMDILASYSTGLHTEGSIRAWKYAGAKEEWLRIHPTQEWFDIYQPFANDDLQSFLDHFLLGKNNGWQQTPRVRLSLLRYHGPPISFRAEDAYPPSRVRYETFLLDAATRSLIPYATPAQDHLPSATTSYQSDSWDDDGAHFSYTFPTATELIGTSQARLYMSCPASPEMDVYVILRKLDRDGTPLLQHDIPDENIYKYIGPSGRVRASKRAALPVDPDLGDVDDEDRRREPTELFFPHDREDPVVPGQVVELRIPIWPAGIVFAAGEMLRLEVKGHDPILPEYPALERGLVNANRGRHLVHTGGEFGSVLVLPLTVV